LPVLKIHRPAVVRIDQVQIPKLSSLVQVRDTRGGQFQQNLRQGIPMPKVSDPPLKMPDILKKKIFYPGIPAPRQ